MSKLLFCFHKWNRVKAVCTNVSYSYVVVCLEKCKKCDKIRTTKIGSFQAPNAANIICEAVNKIISDGVSDE
ncbi:hypothetical protein LCGC14_0452340 [marine sediment metagenome]|uniref:Uncharacterized protein n=1 Tax=marine sediment metagenome TaxID=412755 RepID=A0A0F9VRI4_9ZZZZ